MNIAVQTNLVNILKHPRKFAVLAESSLCRGWADVFHRKKPLSVCHSPRRTFSTLKGRKSNPTNYLKHPVVMVGLPFIFFSVLAAWVVGNAVDGRLKEMEASQGKESKSLRQAKLQEEHDEMMERLNKIVQQDFDNTKRIKRPHEVLEERRLERERRNAWYRRLWRWIRRVEE